MFRYVAAPTTYPYLWGTYRIIRDRLERPRLCPPENLGSSPFCFPEIWEKDVKAAAGTPFVFSRGCVGPMLAMPPPPGVPNWPRLRVRRASAASPAPCTYRAQYGPPATAQDARISRSSDVRFAPESGHSRRARECPLVTQTGHEHLTDRYYLRVHCHRKK